MTVHSGRFGTVDGASTIRNWSIVDTLTLADAVASNTKFGHARRRGIHDWTGSFSGFGHTPPVMPGQSISFIGYTAPDDDVSGVGLRYSGDALVESIAITWNWSAGEIISWVANFGGDGVLTTTAAGAEVIDASTPTLPEVPGTKIEYLDGEDDPQIDPFIEWTDLVQATLTLQYANPTYVNSSTIFSGEVWTRRKKGIFDWNLSVQEQNTDRARFAKGDNLYLRLYVPGGTFWDLAWGRVREFTGLTVDRESGAIMAQTVNLDMNGFLDSDGSAGFVTKPDTTDLWPES